MKYLVITFLTILALVPDEGTASEPIIHGEEGQSYHEFMLKLTDIGYTGSILIEKDGEVIIANGYGLANRKDNIPNTSDTVFTFGSITKQFTGAAIMKLQMQGKLKTSDKITRYFDNVPKDKRKITIHHLLTHTAGFRSMVGDDFDPTSRQDVIDGAMKMRFRWDPGERHMYSNLGYSLLGAIVEIASGQPYERYLHDNLFVPAGMLDTGYNVADWSDNVIAHGYMKDGEDWGTVNDKPWAEDGPYWNLRANGGIMSTVNDMYKWYQALQGTEILDQKSLNDIFTPHVPENREKTWFYGYGWAMTKTERDTRFISHNGGNGIFFADFRMYPDDGILIIYTCNDAPNLTSEMERYIRKQAINPPALP
ncbi:MAG: serine hydrolase domain-containing protein [Candidatus Hydrogenedentota bacterium]